MMTGKTRDERRGREEECASDNDMARRQTFA